VDYVVSMFTSPLKRSFLIVVMVHVGTMTLPANFAQVTLSARTFAGSNGIIKCTMSGNILGMNISL